MIWHRRRDRGGSISWTAGTCIVFAALLAAGAGVSVRVLSIVLWALLGVGVVAAIAGAVRRARANPERSKR